PRTRSLSPSTPSNARRSSSSTTVVGGPRPRGACSPASGVRGTREGPGAGSIFPPDPVRVARPAIGRGLGRADPGSLRVTPGYWSHQGDAWVVAEAGVD